MFLLNKTHIHGVSRSFTFLFIVVFITASILVASPEKAEALTPFGGRSTTVFWCPCSANLLITVGPPVGGLFIYQPGAMLFPFAQIYRPGVWLLGLAAPTAVPCMIFIPYGCAPRGYGLPITMVGTSM